MKGFISGIRHIIIFVIKLFFSTSTTSYDPANLNKRILEIIQIAGIFLGIMAAIINFALKFPVFLIISDLVFSIIMSLCLYLFRGKHYIKISKYICMFTYILFFLPLLWFYNGGSSGASPYFLMLSTTIIAVSVSNENDKRAGRYQRLFLLVLTFLTFIILMIIESVFPQAIFMYKNSLTHIVDISISFFFAGFTSYLLLNIYIHHYHSSIIRLNRYSKKLEGMVIRDSMTNLYNHSYILSILSKEIARTKRYSLDLSIIMIDIDNFKMINDTYGHQFGDRVIIALSKIIQENCRVIDYPGRYGGEEFLLILPETDKDSAYVVGSRIRESLYSESFDNKCRVTFSGGIAQFEDETDEEFLNRADMHLYEAKSTGKNQVKK